MSTVAAVIVFGIGVVLWVAGTSMVTNALRMIGEARRLDAQAERALKDAMYAIEVAYNHELAASRSNQAALRTQRNTLAAMQEWTTTGGADPEAA